MKGWNSAFFAPGMRARTQPGDHRCGGVLAGAVLGVMVLLLGLVPQQVEAQDWNPQASGTANDLYGMSFLNASTGWASGANGTILHTSNGGATWSTQNSGTSNTLRSVFFVDANTGWAVGNNGTIRHTSNGGTTWTAQNSGIPNWLYRTFFIDANTGWAVGISGAILHTSNGGSTWNTQNSGSSSSLLGVFFINANTGWAVGSGGTILRTNNGGSSWSTQTSGTSNSLRGLFFVDANTGWATGANGTILHTSNGGSTWTAQNSGASIWLYRVFFDDANTGWVVGTNGTILHTGDGGTTWTAQNSGTSAPLRDVFFADANTGWIVGDNGTILHTLNGSLPVELTHFDATLDGHDALLTWKTASETNNAGFEIHSKSGAPDLENGAWEVMGFVEGHGTTVLAQAYSYRVEALEPGRHRFRLKQIDYDGTVEYHPEVEVVVEMAERFFVEPVYPNPFNPQAQLRFAVQRAQAVEVGLFDLLGRRVAVLFAGQVSSGQVQAVSIDGRALPSGLYVVRVQGTSFVETQVVTLLK